MLKLYNSLSRTKEVFQPAHPPFVGMYACGPTVYGEPHLGHARPYVTFDVVYRYLSYLGYKVRYVRNITDVGHLENDADEGEDKIAKKARLENLEPMEVAQLYTNSFRKGMDMLNITPPGIEPQASGHIIEQIEMIKKIIAHGYAYVVNGSVYFDIEQYSKNYQYGELSGRVLEDAMAGAGTRELDGQDEKRRAADIALWKNASPEHIMKWPSPWGMGFPGWHIECSAMSAKYLGETFDIHCGGMDLLFPHHECEIAQSKAANNVEPVRYWVHNNMLTINGQKMAKSLGNGISLVQMFTGSSPLLNKPYSPMTLRFFILMAQYRSTIDFSNDALLAAEKSYKRLMNGVRTLDALVYVADETKIDAKLNEEIIKLLAACQEGMDDDFNTAITIGYLFSILKHVNNFKANPGSISGLTAETFDKMKSTFNTYVHDILGLIDEGPANPHIFDEMMHSILSSYSYAKEHKDYATVDKIRADMKKEGIAIKDTKAGYEWAYEE